ncbi:DEAD/DEAH box helicase [Mucilaginibacter phyllosphaerae]|uniref:Superfamily II DNA/RNA helicase n=2 Tax=Mucilaginibacter phyllosphaerae TaxID=1812349 RepID=A0ABR6IB74_9SPHI|nr:DEAD/DEAH box helicase [Mucilaginibacter phyllosphaerae]MBB3970286.1 superfamily II DNA/RNA helicase [Mucilaginibacter phyllosphaerae]GGH11048.1 RNA helicase [Mucilaginibacter phyllosphaerae]
MTFQDFNFNEQLLEGVLSMGYTTPTPIQAMAIPAILNGDDLIACAQTGTGKTASYLLPVLNYICNTHKHHTTALILAPTRELAQQIDQQVEGLAYFTGVSSQAVFGGGDGMAYEQQRRGIQNNVNIIIATPGRLIAHLTSGVLKFNDITHLVLDEADRMLDMGFSDDIMRIIGYLPKKRQTLLFSATMPGRIRTLANAILTDPQQINIAISQPAAGIDQQIYRLHDGQKTPLLKKLLKDGGYLSSIIFASRKEIVKSLYKELKSAHISVAAFHSDLQQGEREEILLKFKNKQLPVIIGTDALSRGIDVEGIDLVVNYDVPGDPEDYVHRIGRTARAATTGTAITFVNDRDLKRLKSIEQLIEKPITEKELPEDLKSIEHVKEERPAGSGQRRDGKRNPKRFGKKKPPRPAAG